MKAVISTKPKTSKNGASQNGDIRLPRASDYKIPKRLSKADKEFIELSQAVLAHVRKVHGTEKKSNG